MSIINQIAATQPLKTFVTRVVESLPYAARVVLLDMIRNGIVRKPPFSGVYRRFDEVAANYPTDATRRAFAKAGLAIKHEEAADLAILRRSHSLLPAVVGMLAPFSKPVRILDFGGSGGIDYLNLKNTIAADVRYHIVDLPAICEAGRELWPSEPAISFSEALPGDEQFDVVYSWSAIHYVPDPLALLVRFTQYKPKAILIVHSPFANRSFVRAQSQGAFRFPQWVVSLPDTERAMREAGYRLIMRATDEFSYNVDNYQPAYRVPHMANLLFVPN